MGVVRWVSGVMSMSDTSGGHLSVISSGLHLVGFDMGVVTALCASESRGNLTGSLVCWSAVSDVRRAQLRLRGVSPVHDCSVSSFSRGFGVSKREYCSRSTGGSRTQ